MQKIAILGGGVSSITAALELTAQPDWQQKYDITLYQLGWRLGGKGASGRNAKHDQRIEEHGLHIWLGFYENAFKLIREVYKEADRDPDSPLGTWDKAFKPHSLIVLEEHFGGEWHNLPVTVPTNPAVPGDGGVLPTPWDYLVQIIRGIYTLYDNHPDKPDSSTTPATYTAQSQPHWWDHVLGEVEAITNLVVEDAGKFLQAALHLVESLDPNPYNHDSIFQHAFLWLLKEFKAWLWEHVKDLVNESQTVRLLWLNIDQMTANAYGIVADGVIYHGFDVIDGMDYRAWLMKNSANQFTVDTALFQAGYDLVFGYRYGHVKWSEATLDAGVGLRGVVRMFLTFKGAISYEMQAGMGDTIFAPAYTVLKNRGVKFEFFHNVKNLGLSPDGNLVETIDMGVQATVKPELGEYNPIEDIKGVPSWPSEPFYDQLVEGEKLIAGNINLESAWTDWQDVAHKTLKLGEDFDTVVFGISLGTVPYLCKEMVAAKPKWQAMVENVKTVRTQASQLWFSEDRAGLGWDVTTDAPLVGGYAEPLSTWADMTFLIEREDWPENNMPKNLAYLVGAMDDDPDQPPPYTSDPSYPATQKQKIIDLTKEWLDKDSPHLWPDAQKDGAFNWSLLVGDDKSEGEDRLLTQYFRVNIDPSERYVLSAAGSTQYRLRTDETDIANLYITGDWLRNGLNSGCVESAVVSGMQTSRAISGYPQQIIGEDDNLPVPPTKQTTSTTSTTTVATTTNIQPPAGVLLILGAILGWIVSRILFRRKQ